MTDSTEVVFLTRSDIGGWFGVGDQAVAKWQSRYPPSSPRPFPPPRHFAGMVRRAPLWHPDREQEIREWRVWHLAQPKGGRPAGTRPLGAVDA